MKFVRFFEDFTQNTQDPTFSDIYFARNKNNTTRQSKQTRRAFVKLDGFALPDAGGFGNSDGENDFVFGLPLLGSGVDAGGADEIELMIDGVEKNAHIAQDEVSKLCLLRRFLDQITENIEKIPVASGKNNTRKERQQK